jgi:hypothetical protein
MVAAWVISRCNRSDPPLSGTPTKKQRVVGWVEERNPSIRGESDGGLNGYFAVDPELVFVTTKLAGVTTRFLPFNQGRFGGAGNPPVPPTRHGYATDYC